MSRVHPAAGGTLLAVALGAAMPAQNFTLYGAGCGQPLQIAHDSPLIPGMTTRLTLDHAGGSGALLVLGLQATAVPLLGCTLLAQPDATQFRLVDALGHAEYPLAIPGLVAFTGLSLFDQWLALDPVGGPGISFSQGATATVTNPQVTFGAYQPASGGIGTIVTLTMGGLGTTNPDNVCLRVMNPTGGSSLLRVLNIAPGGGGQATVTAVLRTVSSGPIGQGALGAMRGSGQTTAVPPGVKLSAPSEGWGWNGADTPQAGGNGGPFVPLPSPATPIQFALVGNSIRATLPPGPYTPGQAITLDVHWNVTCPGQPQVHYDHFLGTMTVLASMTATDLRDEIAPKIAAVFNNLWPGRVQVNVPTPVGPQVVVTMVDPTCTIVGGSGSLYVQ